MQGIWNQVRLLINQISKRSKDNEEKLKRVSLIKSFNVPDVTSATADQTKNIKTYIGEDVWNLIKENVNATITFWSYVQHEKSAIGVPITLKYMPSTATTTYNWATGVFAELYSFPDSGTGPPGSVIKAYQGIGIRADGSIRFAVWQEKSGTTSSFVGNYRITRIDIRNLPAEEEPA